MANPCLKAGTSILDPEEHQRRLELYRQGLTDREIAEALGGISKGGIQGWRYRNKLPRNFAIRRKVDKRTKRMEDVLTPSECARVRAFFGRLINCADQVPKGQKLDVGAFMTAWRDIY